MFIFIYGLLHKCADQTAKSYTAIVKGTSTVEVEFWSSAIIPKSLTIRGSCWFFIHGDFPGHASAFRSPHKHAFIFARDGLRATIALGDEWRAAFFYPRALRGCKVPFCTFPKMGHKCMYECTDSRLFEKQIPHR